MIPGLKLIQKECTICGLYGESQDSMIQDTIEKTIIGMIKFLDIGDGKWQMYVMRIMMAMLS